MRRVACLILGHRWVTHWRKSGRTIYCRRCKTPARGWFVAECVEPGDSREGFSGSTDCCGGSVGIELNPEYAELCARRLQQLSLLADGEAA